jgi:tetratricopeptide (TPR) repeat protein
VVRLTASIDELEARIGEAESLIAGLDGATSDADRLELARALIERGDAQRELPDNAAAVEWYDRAVAAVAAVGAMDCGDIEVREVRALAWSRRASALFRLGQAADALAETELALGAAAGADTGRLRRCQASASLTRAGALLRLGRAAEAQQVAEGIVAEFAGDPVHGPKRTNVVAGGRFTRALALIAQDKAAEAEAELSSLIADYEHDEEPSVQLLIAKSRLQRARALDLLGRGDDAGGIREGLLDEYGGCPDRQFREVGLLAGARHGLRLLGAEQPARALEIAQQLRQCWDAQPLPGNPKLVRDLWLLLADAQLRLDQTDQAIGTLRTLLDRDDLLSGTPSRVGKIADLLGAAIGQLARADQPAQALRLTDEALARLGPHTPDPDRLALLWLDKAWLFRQIGDTDAAIAACEQTISTFADRRTERGRHALISAQRQKAITLGTTGRTRAAIAIYDRLIDTHRDEPETAIREVIAAIMADRAQLQLQRHRSRSALRDLNQLRDYCGDSPSEPLQQWADHARTRSAAITTRIADRRRLLTIALAPLAIWTAPSIITVLRTLRQSKHRKQTAP